MDCFDQICFLDDKYNKIVTHNRDGEYGHSDVSIGVPAVLGKNGVEEIIQLELNDSEKDWFEKGVKSVKDAISGINV